MASCGILDEEVLNSPELQAVKNSLKDENMKLGMQQLMKTLMKLAAQNPEDQLVSKHSIQHTTLYYTCGTQLHCCRRTIVRLACMPVYAVFCRQYCYCMVRNI